MLHFLVSFLAALGRFFVSPPLLLARFEVTLERCKGRFDAIANVVEVVLIAQLREFQGLVPIYSKVTLSGPSTLPIIMLFW